MQVKGAVGKRSHPPGPLRTSDAAVQACTPLPRTQGGSTSYASSMGKTKPRGQTPCTIPTPSYVSLGLKSAIVILYQHGSNSGKLTLYWCQHLGTVRSGGVQKLGTSTLHECPKFAFGNICILKKKWNLKNGNYVLLFFLQCFIVISEAGSY